MALLPQYKSHKEIQAFQIEDIRPGVKDQKGAVLAGGAHAVEVGPAFLKKHEPKVGGWYVLYRDGYESWSPDKEFRDGYTLLSEVANREATTQEAKELRERCMKFATGMHPPGTDNGLVINTAEALRNYIETGATGKANA